MDTTKWEYASLTRYTKGISGKDWQTVTTPRGTQRTDGGEAQVHRELSEVIGEMGTDGWELTATAIARDDTDGLLREFWFKRPIAG
jgi:hypothetical protein